MNLAWCLARSHFSSARCVDPAVKFVLSATWRKSARPSNRCTWGEIPTKLCLLFPVFHLTPLLSQSKHVTMTSSSSHVTQYIEWERSRQISTGKSRTIFPALTPSPPRTARQWGPVTLRPDGFNRVMRYTLIDRVKQLTLSQYSTGEAETP